MSMVHHPLHFLARNILPLVMGNVPQVIGITKELSEPTGIEIAPCDQLQDKCLLEPPM